MTESGIADRLESLEKIHEQPPHCWGFRGMTGDEARLSDEVEV
jgi:hypothetical protein